MEGPGRLEAVQRPEKLCLCERQDILHPVTYLVEFFLGGLDNFYGFYSGIRIATTTIPVLKLCL